MSAVNLWEIKSFFKAKEDLYRIKQDMYAIKLACEITIFSRGDLTGDVYGFTYNGLEKATQLLVEFERKAAAFIEEANHLYRVLDSEDFKELTDGLEWVHLSVKDERHYVTSMYETIKQFFDKTHSNYNNFPAPKRKEASNTQSLFNLVAYASLFYTIFHIFK